MRYYLLGVPINVKCSEFDNNHFIGRQLNINQILILTQENRKKWIIQRKIPFLVYLRMIIFNLIKLY